MVDDRISQLSDMQRQCLRLAAEGRSSKEIGPMLGLSHNTVDQYLHRARVILGADNRREAARIFTEIESIVAFKRLELKSCDIAKPPFSAISEAPAEQSGSPPKLLGLPPRGGQPNDLSSHHRLIAIGKIALFLMIVMLGMIILIKAAFIVLS
ncbi:helix-turn-helix transcriptional regulator [Sphingobium sp. AN558]|uniref:helix-turn-helix domain-containing protein n=1 Tax=Sphingobium sp. AN558 TaxID=3133442 RepID=UPI0030BE4531